METQERRHEWRPLSENVNANECDKPTEGQGLIVNVTNQQNDCHLLKTEKTSDSINPTTPKSRVVGRKTLLERVSGETPEGKRLQRKSEPTMCSVTSSSDSLSFKQKISLCLDIPASVQTGIKASEVAKEAKKFYELNTSITSQDSSFEEAFSSSVESIEEGDDSDDNIDTQNDYIIMIDEKNDEKDDEDLQEQDIKSKISFPVFDDDNNNSDNEGENKNNETQSKEDEQVLKAFTVHNENSEDSKNIEDSKFSNIEQKSLVLKQFSDTFRPVVQTESNLSDPLSNTIENSEKDSLIASLNLKIQCLSEALINAEQDSLQYQEECLKARENSRQLTASVISLNNRIKIQNNKMRMLEIEIKASRSLSNDLSNHDKALLERFEAEKDVYKENIAKLEEELEKERNESQNYQVEMEDAKKELKQIEELHKVLQKSSNEKEKELAGKYELASLELEALKEAHSNISEELDVKKRMHQSLQAINETQTRQLSEKDEQISDLKKELEEKQKTIELLSQEKANLVNNIDELKAENLKLNEKLASFNNNNETSDKLEKASDKSTSTSKLHKNTYNNFSRHPSNNNLRSAPISTKFSIGDKVNVMGKISPGIIQFIGTTEFSDGEWYGIELEQPEGKSNGTVNGKTYFSCPDKCAVFVKQSSLVPLKKVFKQRSKLIPPSSYSKLTMPEGSELSELIAVKQENEITIQNLNKELEKMKQSSTEIEDYKKQIKQLTKKLEEKEEEIKKLSEELSNTKIDSKSCSDLETIKQTYNAKVLTKLI